MPSVREPTPALQVLLSNLTSQDGNEASTGGTKTGRTDQSQPNNSSLSIQVSANNANNTESKSDDGFFAKLTDFDFGVFFESPWVFIILGFLALLCMLLLILIVYCGVRWFKNRKVEQKRQLFQKIAGKTRRIVLGHVDLILTYDYGRAILGVELLQVRDLDFGKKQVEEKEVEIFCMVSLLPDLKKLEKTKIVSKSFSPVFNEKFDLRCVIDDLDYKQILVRVIRHFKCLRDAPIGDSVLKLSKKNLQLGYSSVPILSYNPNLDDPLGEICVTLRYNANTKKLGITILECKELKERDWGGNLDPYCTCVVKIGDKVLGKNKTPPIKKTRNPYFNAVFSYKVPPNKLSNVDVLIKIKDKDILGSAQELGSIRFGREPDSEKAERQWSQMIEFMKKPQTEWHYLLMSEK